MPQGRGVCGERKERPYLFAYKIYVLLNSVWLPGGTAAGGQGGATVGVSEGSRMFLLSLSIAKSGPYPSHTVLLCLP